MTTPLFWLHCFYCIYWSVIFQTSLKLKTFDIIFMSVPLLLSLLCIKVQLQSLIEADSKLEIIYFFLSLWLFDAVLKPVLNRHAYPSSPSPPSFPPLFFPQFYLITDPQKFLSLSNQRHLHNLMTCFYQLLISIVKKPVSYLSICIDSKSFAWDSPCSIHW